MPRGIKSNNRTLFLMGGQLIRRGGFFAPRAQDLLQSPLNCSYKEKGFLYFEFQVLYPIASPAAKVHRLSRSDDNIILAYEIRNN
jgi:hypothetical protein